MSNKILMLGVGQTAKALAEFYRGGEGLAGGDKAEGRDLLYGTTRSAEKLESLSACGIKPVLFDSQNLEVVDQLADIANGAWVLVSFPPDGGQVDPLVVDKLIAPALKRAKKVVYISSTGVYGNASGKIDENTVCVRDGASVVRLDAEQFWRVENGACVLRAPGLYGPKNGLHKRLLSGTYKLPGDGSNFVSRIHLDDLAHVIDSAFKWAQKGSLYAVGDLKPSTHLEAVSWLCERLHLPLPPSVPIDQVGPTLRGNRQIDSSLMREQLSVELKYPTYVEGFSQCLAN